MMGLVWPFVRGLLFGSNGMVVAIIAGVIAFGAWRAYDIGHQRAIGAEQAVAKVQEATNAAVKTADRVRAKSGTRRVRGERDPHALD